MWKIISRTAPLETTPAVAYLYMHGHMLVDLLQALVGVIAFPVCFVTPGYLAASACNIMGFRERSLPEKLLWAVALSGPLSTVITCLGGRVLSATPMLALLLATAVAALIVLARDLRLNRDLYRLGREFWIAIAAMLFLAAYCILATIGVQTRHSLYESVVSIDWSVRIPLVNAAARAGVPPFNPLYAVAGQPPPMRYYYYWYVLCAQVMRLTHITARATFAASTVWAAFSLLSVTLLYVKYLSALNSTAAVCAPDVQRPAPFASLRRICLVAIALPCAMSLYLLPALIVLIDTPRKPFLEIEFWMSDRMPSWLGATLFAPHHIAGVAFGGLGFLLLATMPQDRRQKLVHALLAAVCFSALVGTSTYLSLCFAVAGFLLLVIRLKARHWEDIGMLAVCTIAALLLTFPFLREMTQNAGYSAAEHASAVDAKPLIANHMFKVVLRNWHTAYGFMTSQFDHYHIPFPHSHLRYLLTMMALPIFYITDLNFYVFILWYQAKADFRRDRPATENALCLWALFLGFALPGLLLNSEPTQGVNDFGRHTGLAVRLVLTVWAAPMLANTWLRLRKGCKPARAGRWAVALTTAGIVLGLGGELWQVTSDRVLLPLIAHNVVQVPESHLANAPFLQARNATEAVEAATPANAILQSNPEGRYQPVFTLYLNRQAAAGDGGCESAFGGNIDRCKAEVIAPLHAIFGGKSLTKINKDDPQPILPDTSLMTAAHFRDTCSALHLTALLVSSADPVWQFPSTWVWTQPAMYDDGSVRVILCPTTNTSHS